MRTATHDIDSLGPHTITADVTCRGLLMRGAQGSASDAGLSIWGIDPAGIVDSQPWTWKPEEQNPIPIPLYRQPVQKGTALFVAQALSGTVTIEMLYDDFAAAPPGGPGKT